VLAYFGFSSPPASFVPFVPFVPFVFFVFQRERLADRYLRGGV